MRPWRPPGCPAVLRSLTLILAVLATTAPCPRAQEPSVPQSAVDAAIDRGVRSLLRAQGPDGSWPTGRPGRTALALYALLKSGVDPQSDAVQRGLAFLATHDVQHTYDAAILAQLLETLEQPEYHEWIEVLAERLAAWQLDGGDWSYPQGEGDLSNTQYAALGLWVAGKADALAPVEVWEQLYDGVQRYSNRAGHFGYSRGARGVRPSMTAAGIATLAICRWGLEQSGALSPQAARQIERAEERGVEALAADIDAVLSAREGGWPFYKLYAVERVGALLGITHLGQADWYQVGAANLLAAQNDHGGWGGESVARAGGGFDRRRGDPFADVRTAFALLFLRRATSFTGTGGGARRTVFGTDSAEAEVQVRATGGDPLTLFVTGWGPRARERFEWPREQGDGPHVSRVEYLVDGQVVAVVEADPTRAAGLERFAVQHALPRSGAFVVQVRATVHAAPREGHDEPGRASVLSSPPFEVEVAGIVPGWVREQSGDRHRNLLPAGEPDVRASSALRQGGVDHAPENAVDNFGLTTWLARPEDDRPRLTIRLDRPQRADVILLASPRPVPHREGFYARPMEVEVVVNEEETHRVLMPPDERRKARLELERPVRVRQLDLTIRWKAPGQVESTGLAEVELQLR